MRKIRFKNGRDPRGFACCDVCGYPYKEPRCPNPGCRSNMSTARITEVDARIAQDAADEAESAKIRAIRNRSFSSK